MFTGFVQVNVQQGDGDYWAWHIMEFLGNMGTWGHGIDTAKIRMMVEKS